MRWLLATALSVFSAATLAQSTPLFEFKGFRIGETTYAQVQSANQFECRTIKEPVADYACQARRETIAGAPTSSVLLVFYGDKLTTIMITFGTEDFQQVKRALEDKYGQGKIASSTVQNRMGASFDNETITWRSSGSSMTLKMRDRKIDQASLSITASTAVDEFNRRVHAADKKNAGDL